MSTIKVNTITTRSGSTITLGESGKTITLACGASQTGFGRTGTVNWCTTAKTSPFTSESGKGYFINTSSGAVTVTLPSSPSAGDIVSVSDYAKTAACNAITIGRNSSKIDGLCNDLLLETNGLATTLVYVDSTKGWKPVNSNEVANELKFVTATGGTITTSGDFKIHTFTSDATFTVSCAGSSAGSNTVDYLVVAGAGGGGNGLGGGGGAGGYRESSGAASGCYSVSPLGSGVSALPVSAQDYPITVGAGGGAGAAGSNSVFSTITSAGGGLGGQKKSGANVDAGAGGSGGGQRSAFPCSANSQTPVGGAGNTPPVSPPQGNTGGRGFDGSCVSSNSGGGGGATAVGFNAQGPSGTPKAGGGNGGTGATSSINGTPTGRAGGGGGGADNNPGGAGTQGGGDGRTPSSPTTGEAGTANTGGGGGGGGSNPSASGGAGGSGIVIIRYKFQ
jgi:hypothetical protein